jgi:hypothetical protein
MEETTTPEVKFDDGQIRDMISEKIPWMTKYMKFVGTFSIIIGIVYCVTIIGAIFGIPLYFMGKRLRESADSFLRYRRSGSGQDLYSAIERQTRAFYIQYIFVIISLVLLGLYIIGIIVFLIVGISSGLFSNLIG